MHQNEKIMATQTEVNDSLTALITAVETRDANVRAAVDAAVAAGEAKAASDNDATKARIDAETTKITAAV